MNKKRPKKVDEGGHGSCCFWGGGGSSNKSSKKDKKKTKNTQIAEQLRLKKSNRLTQEESQHDSSKLSMVSINSKQNE